MLQRDSIGGTLTIAAGLCVVCSIVVASTAVGLRSIRERNEQLSFQKEVLKVAGLYDEEKNKPAEIPELFQTVEPVLVSIDEAAATENPDVSMETFDIKVISSSPEFSEEIPAEKDYAGIKRRETITKIYLVKKEDGQLDQIILPVRGKGLWSTMWGLLSLDRDGKTVRGLTFYQDGETPGLGGEINNSKWKASWSNPECPKVLFNEEGQVTINFYKGAVNCETENSEHLFEALAGATITTRGVENMMKYWLGDHGYGPLLKKVQEGTFPEQKTASR